MAEFTRQGAACVTLYNSAMIVLILARYHLGLIIPKDLANCFIAVEGQRRTWLDGQDLIFDDNMWHSVENNTPERRVVLFVDFRRDYGNFFTNGINWIATRLGGFNHKTKDIIRLQNLYHEAHERPRPKQ